MKSPGYGAEGDESPLNRHFWEQCPAYRATGALGAL
jgi:hypothetical protein